MPDLGDELDGGRLEGVAVGNLNVDFVQAAGVWCIGRCGKGALQMQQVGLVERLSKYSRVVPVIANVTQLLEDASLLGAGHVADALRIRKGCRWVFLRRKVGDAEDSRDVLLVEYVT